MGLGLDMNKNLVSEGLASEVLVVHLIQTSKPVGVLLIPAVAANNQPFSQTEVGSERLREAGRNMSAIVVY